MKDTSSSPRKRAVAARAAARAAALVAAVALGLAGCATSTPGAGSSGAGDAPRETLTWDGELDVGVPGHVVETHRNVTYYPACGTEVLSWGDETYYPYNPTQLDAFPDPADEVTRASALEKFAHVGWARMSAPLPAVAPPEPGQDVGVLVIYQGGHAYWESESGDISTWLTTTELEYGWIC